MSRPAAFPNVQGICYFNSLFQCILVALKKRSIIKIKDGDERPVNIINLKNIHIRLEKKNIQFMKFDGDQCAAEMYSALLEAYDEFPMFTNRFISKYYIVRMCKECRTDTRSHEETNIIILPNIQNVTVNDKEDVEFRCPCGGNSSTKYSILTEAARILVFQVKRGPEPNIINFPDVFRGRRRVASIHHFGGHYVACVLYDIWWIADDDKIIPGKLTDDSIYMIFYRE